MHCFAGDDKAEDDSDEDENRDRGKARKYNKLADAKAIPQHIVQMIEEDSKKSAQTSPVQDQSDKQIVYQNREGRLPNETQPASL